MRLTIIILLTSIQIQVSGQRTFPIDLSPDGKFGLIVTASQLPDVNTEWTYRLVSKKSGGNDTLLLTTAITHDDPPPATFWDKSSRQLIYEDRSSGEDSIKIYQLFEKKVVFETQGFTWGGKQNFDQERGIIFFFQYVDRITLDLKTLDIETKEIKRIKTIRTSGDPLTGVPLISNIDFIQRELTLTVQNSEYKSEKLKVKY